VSLATITVYEDEGGGWRWRLALGNHLKFAASGERFDSRSNARRAAMRMADLIANEGTEVEVVEVER